jgi:histidinol-phosphate aminotransferase
VSHGAVTYRIRPQILEIEPYVPGKPIAEVERELGIAGAVKLASNENPLGPSPAALEAVRQSLGGLHRYPDGGGTALRGAIAARLKVSPEAVILGNGSDEVVDLLAKTLLVAGDEAVMAAPTFGIYRIAVLAHQGRPIEVPLAAGRHDLDAMARAVTPRTRLFFLCNPNSPTGTALSRHEVDALVARLPDHVVVVCDHAYEEYAVAADFPQTAALVANGRVVVLRTFSKIYGLAGLRIGYGVGSPDLIGVLNRVRLPFNASTVAQVAAVAALGDEAHVRASRMVNAAGKTYLTAAFAKLGLAFYPTEANFLYVDVGRDGRAVFERLLREGVIVRHIEGARLRITIGLPEENQKCVAALERVLAEI